MVAAVNALVTGAGGFLGLYIVEQLLAGGHAVRALCRQPSPALDALGVETARADLHDRAATVAACRGMDVVFHAGGITGIGGPWKRYYQVNTEGTRHVVEGCRTHGVGRLVFTSSPSVTFDGRDQRGIDESAPYAARWLSAYARSKALAEQHVLAANDPGALLTCALRPHLIWGPRDRQLVPRLLARAVAGRLCRVGDGSNLIDTVYVENAAEAHLLAAAALAAGSPAAGRAYFISQGEPVNCWQWVDDLLALAGLPPLRKTMSLRVAWLLGASLEVLYRVFRLRGEPPMTRFLAAQMARCHYFDLRRAREDIGYRARISMAEGMRRLAASWRREGVGGSVSEGRISKGEASRHGMIAGD
jgi:nucleoside-diphosphate-sugar epimerase